MTISMVIHVNTKLLTTVLVNYMATFGCCSLKIQISIFARITGLWSMCSCLGFALPYKKSYYIFYFYVVLFFQFFWFLFDRSFMLPLLVYLSRRKREGCYLPSNTFYSAAYQKSQMPISKRIYCCLCNWNFIIKPVIKLYIYQHNLY